MTSPESSPAGYSRRWWALGVLTLSLVIIGMDNTIMNVAIPTIQSEFNATASQLQWMIDSYILVFAGLLLTMGGLGDRFGRAKMLRIGLLLFALTSVAASQARSEGQLIAARAVLGIGGAMIMPATLSIIVDLFRGPERARAISIWAAGAGIAMPIGPLVGGLLLAHYAWGSVFLINVPVAAIALIAGWRLIPDSRDRDPKPLDLAGALLSTAAVSVLVFAIIEAPARGWASLPVIGMFGLSAALAIAFAWWETRVTHPLLNFDFFRRPRFSGGAGAISIAFFALMGLVFGFTQYLQFVKGYTPLEAGVRMLPIAAGMAISARMSERLSRRFGTKRVVAAGLVVLGSTIATISFFQPDSPYWLIGLSMFFVATGMGAVMAPSTDAVMGAVPRDNAGVASAMNDVARQVAGALGVAIIGSVLNSLYMSRVTAAVDAAVSAAGGRIPDVAAAAARDSVGAAVHVSASLPPAVGEPLAQAARAAFTDAFGLAVLAGSALALAGALLVLRWLPARGGSDEETDRSQVPVAATNTSGAR